MNSKICHDTLVGIPEYFQKHQHMFLSIVELTIFYIAKLRFSRILSHPFWYKSHFFDQRKDEFENLSRYTCWHTRVLSKTPAPVALHRRAYHILHCKDAIFPNFEPSLLIQKSFCLTREKMNSKICHDTLVGIPEYFQKHQHLLLSIVELTIFYIAKVRFSRILSHPFWYKSHFFDQRKDEFVDLSWYTCWHIQSAFKNTSTCCSPSQSLPYFTLQRCDFPEFWAIPFDTKVIFSTREKMNSKICHDTLVGIPEYFQKHQHLLLSIVELTTFYIANLRLSRILSHPFWYKSHFFDRRKDEFENLSWYPCWHTRVLSQTPAPVALHRRAYHILHCKRCEFPDFWASPFDTKVIFFTRKKMNSKICHDTHVGIPESFRKHKQVLLSIVELTIFYIAKLRFSRILMSFLLIQKSFLWPEKIWIRKSVTIYLFAYQSTFKNTSTCFSPS